MNYASPPIADASMASILKSANSISEPWFIQLWNAPGFSEFAVGIIVALSSVGVAIYNNLHQRKQTILDKRKQVAENILDPFNEFLLGIKEIGSNKDMPLMARAVMTIYYSIDVEKKEFNTQLKKTQTLAELYTPNYIKGLVSTLTLQCLGMLTLTQIQESQLQMVKDSIDDLSKDLIKWIKSDSVRGNDKTFRDIAKEIKEKSRRRDKVSR